MYARLNTLEATRILFTLADIFYRQPCAHAYALIAGGAVLPAAICHYGARVWQYSKTAVVPFALAQPVWCVYAKLCTSSQCTPKPNECFCVLLLLPFMLLRLMVSI